MSKTHILAPPRVEGVASRQAHTDLPDGTYERELGREGFFGPATPAPAEVGGNWSLSGAGETAVGSFVGKR